ncbi:hypothetical protein Bbelb_369030 [Branchiostoma belcheri]|nr:hypothetical protein Bbelb_369030 [Branchiostoma belcheri]
MPFVPPVRHAITSGFCYGNPQTTTENFHVQTVVFFSTATARNDVGGCRQLSGASGGSTMKNHETAINIPPETGARTYSARRDRIEPRALFVVLTSTFGRGARLDCGGSPTTPGDEVAAVSTGLVWGRHSTHGAPARFRPLPA